MQTLESHLAGSWVRGQGAADTLVNPATEEPLAAAASLGLDLAGDLARTVPAPGGKQRTVTEAILLMAWHEAHHQGQIHLTWNLFKAAAGA